MSTDPLLTSLMAYPDLGHKPEWIDAEKRKPQHGERVLYVHPDGDVVIGCWRDDGDSGPIKDNAVRWWMPLPTPPQEQP